MAIITNRKFKSATTLDTATNTYTLANFQSSGETVTAVAVNQIFFSSNGTWTIARGANTIAVLSGAGHWNLAGHNCPIQQDSTGTLVLTLSASSVGTIILDVRKLNSAVETSATS